MCEKIILGAEHLGGYLNDRDRSNLACMREHYLRAIECYRSIDEDSGENDVNSRGMQKKIIKIYDEMGQSMQEIAALEDALRVYCFETHSSRHGEVSRLIAKLRDTRTRRHEFVYYIQRAYELLFNLAWAEPGKNRKNYLVVKTPVGVPSRNYAVHKIPNVDEHIRDTVMCVMLRGALLPSMILSKEIQEYSSDGMVTPFALFRIKRDDSKSKDNMEYVLDLEMSYFDLEILDGKHLVFADPMNATGGSLVTIIQYLLGKGVRPLSIKAFNVIASLEGALQTLRAVEKVEIFTLWMDPFLNDKAYILPGLGDAGDRINGKDGAISRSIIQLVADYGADMASLYRDQVREIERTVLRV